MNLLYEPWLPFRCRDGEIVTRPISAIVDSNIIDFALPRADFQGAAYQLVIGLLQTTFAPQDKKEWYALYQNAPEQNQLEEAFKQVSHAFELDGDGPRFMQDLDPLNGQKPSDVFGLLIDAPGENGIKNNTDLFVKRCNQPVLSPAMAAIALFTLQINAPSGGSGHRVGLRGGGPLTTLVMPQDRLSTLWQKLWLNVINRSYWKYDDPNFHDGSVFPWLAPTRESSSKGSEIYLSSPGIHPLHVYWAMPRRIRLIFEDCSAVCSLSGQAIERGVYAYRTKNLGNNYCGDWDPTPFTPYCWNPKKAEADHISQKGQRGGITYRTWEILTLTDSEKSGHVSARVVDHYTNIARRRLSDNPRIWAFGYDMDNMKARGWYSQTMPLFVVDEEIRDEFIYEINSLQRFSSEAILKTRNSIKAAWFARPGDVGGDMTFIEMSFWQSTEEAFFKTAAHVLSNLSSQQSALTPLQATEFKQRLQKVCEALFDNYALVDSADFRSLERQLQARSRLMGWLHGGKLVKTFDQNYHVDTTKGK